MGRAAAGGGGRAASEVGMTDNEQKTIESLLEGNDEFRELYDRHNELKSQVRDAELGHAPMDSMRLGELKREKLRAKDRMATLIAEHQQQQGESGVPTGV